MSGDREGAAPSLIERLARAGLVAKPLLYATVGALAASAAVGVGGRATDTTDTRGAMATVMQAPLGRVLLAATAASPFGYALWRVVEAIADPENRGRDARG